MISFERIDGRGYGYIFPLLLLRKCAGKKRGHRGKEIDWCGERWNDRDGFIIFMQTLCSARLARHKYDTIIFSVFLSMPGRKRISKLWRVWLVHKYYGILI